IPVVVDDGVGVELFADLRRDCTTRWLRTGFAPQLDVGRLIFTLAEVASVVEGDCRLIASRMTDARWLHGLDKAAGGRGVVAGGPASQLAEAAGATRFDGAVRRARFDSWLAIVDTRLVRATQALSEGRVDDALLSAQVAGPLAAATLEAWGER